MIAWLLAPVLLYPILKITRTYQLSSLADLIALPAAPHEKHL